MEARSTPALLLFKGLVTEHRTEKWSITLFPIMSLRMKIDWIPSKKLKSSPTISLSNYRMALAVTCKYFITIYGWKETWISHEMTPA